MNELQKALDKAVQAIEKARDLEDDLRASGIDTEGLGDVLAKASHQIEMYLD